jgi:hypothetical protein
VAELGERLEVAPGTAAQIEDRERWRAANRPQERRDILRDVVVARALPEILGALVVVLQRAPGDVFQVPGAEAQRDLDVVNGGTGLPLFARDNR